jgi:hypothetical protein
MAAIRNGCFTSIRDVQWLATNVRSESNTIKLIGFWPWSTLRLVGGKPSYVDGPYWQAFSRL